ncbi:farnesyl-diphosphate farnesyltransferase [Halobiforma haloterrestris]|uniref:Farnesyl-diphosphate farnesyltransferase n=1 Tax=Natronobacterium haloterrestre TaxID=148448 RepID=A0A1I1LGL0_NATHA|nr:phytoene/squalene synthase family protein [Halobiforma haloterrestris]SFC72327.1 farnesyl-diphosphate farnesyltransferase [Halobiforma haloterrestris]
MTQDQTNSKFDRSPDLSYCHTVVQDVSRTFALTIDLLNEPLSDHICVGYLLCRIPDTIEDAVHIPAQSQCQLLQTYQAAIDPSEPTSIHTFVDAISPWAPPQGESADWDVVRAAPTVLATFETFSSSTKQAIRPQVKEMTGGMSRFIDRYSDRPGLRIQTGSELDRYCHYVAGTVGTLITDLLPKQSLTTVQAQTLERTAEDFGRLLQLVNIAKDVREDFLGEQNVYLPSEWLEAESVSQDHLLDDENRDSVSRVLDRVLDRARSCLNPAAAYIQAMPTGGGNTVAAWAVPYLLAVATLRKLKNQPTAALTTGKVKVSREEVHAILSATQECSSERVRTLRHTIERDPLHTTTESLDVA